MRDSQARPGGDRPPLTPDEFLERLRRGDQDVDELCADVGLPAESLKVWRFDDPHFESRYQEILQNRAGGGSTIGPYRLLQKLGEGGMGEVWEAEQREPVKRRVAFKVIRPQTDTESVIARFEAERQALALMDHPSIARVFEAGETPQGRPYFVMELVHGVPITEYCDTHKLSTRERIELFRRVCAGVQHAHQKAVIHRDLKPSNVLVTLVDGRPVPKIIDFGVAKAISRPLTDRPMVTEFGQLLGTPEYMSPEQAEMSAQGVDTRTDVYSLGVILYEMLTGSLPFDSQALRSAAFDEIRRVIREDEPPRPSTRVSQAARLTAEPAARRGTSPDALARQLSGDLDWVVMRALEKDRMRRYGSPMELAEDLERHLEDRPVSAGPPSASYRLRKFIRRHRLGVSAAAATTVLIIAFVIVMGIQADRLAAERDRANAEAERARIEAASAERVTGFLIDLFTVSEPSEARGNTVTAREILDRGAEQIESELADEPKLQSRLMGNIGLVYKNLGLLSTAEPLLSRSRHLAIEVHGADSPPARAASTNLANLYWRLGRADLAEPIYTNLYHRRLELLGPDDEKTLISANNLATFYATQHRYKEAVDLLADTLERRRRLFGEDHQETLASMSNLAETYRRAGRSDEAGELLQETLAARRRVLGDDHPETLTAMANLALWHKSRGQLDRSLELELSTLELRRRVLGDEHHRTLDSMNNLGNLYRSLGRYKEAEPLLLQVLEIRQRLFGEGHPRTLSSYNNIAELYRASGRYREAEDLYLKALETGSRIRGRDHVDTVVSIHNLACLYRDTGRLDEARAHFETAQEAWEASLSEDHPYLVENLLQHAALLRLAGDTEEAEALEARAEASRR